MYPRSAHLCIQVKALGKPETRETILAHFVYLCRENMHTVLVMSPIGDNFRTRLRMFPSLVNCMTIDWYNLWPKDALKSVAKRFFDKVACKLPGASLWDGICVLFLGTVRDCGGGYPPTAVTCQLLTVDQQPLTVNRRAPAGDGRRTTS